MTDQYDENDPPPWGDPELMAFERDLFWGLAIEVRLLAALPAILCWRCHYVANILRGQPEKNIAHDALYRVHRAIEKLDIRIQYIPPR
jgi:hypothetical protein